MGIAPRIMIIGNIEGKSVSLQGRFIHGAISPEIHWVGDWLEGIRFWRGGRENLSSYAESNPGPPGRNQGVQWLSCSFHKITHSPKQMYVTN